MLFYDPVGRVVATLHPDDSYDKTVFDPWHTETWDANDTVLLDPREDPDVARLRRPLPRGARRAAGRLGDLVRAAHRRRPGPRPSSAPPSRRRRTRAPRPHWLDTLGRTFLTVAHNRVPAADGGLADQFCRTHSLLDIQGNEHEVRDALGRAVMRYGYAMLAAQVTQAGMDTGGGVLLPDVTGKPVYSRNSRGFAFRTDYDALRRPVRSYVAGPGITGEALQTRTEYGESLPDAEARNLRDAGRPAVRRRRRHRQRGVRLQGQPAAHQRGSSPRVYRDVVDWSAEVPLESGVPQPHQL